MPTVFVQGQIIELNTTEYYLFWHRYMQTLRYLTHTFSYFPKTVIAKHEFEEYIWLLQTNIDKLGDAELRERAVELIELVKPLPDEHQRMVAEIISQLKILNPQFPSGKRQLNMKWRKLIDGQAPTEEMKIALISLRTYADWFIHRTDEISRNVEHFQKRIDNLYPQVKERLSNP